MRTWIALPAWATKTEDGLKAHESTVMRRFTSSNGSGKVGANVDSAAVAANALAANANDAAADFRNDMDTLWFLDAAKPRHYPPRGAPHRYRPCHRRRVSSHGWNALSHAGTPP